MAKRGRKSVLTPELVARIQERKRSGISFRDLAREFGLGRGTIEKAVRTGAPKAPRKPPEKKAAAKPPGANGASTIAVSADDHIESMLADVAMLLESARGAEGEGADMSRIAAATSLRLKIVTLAEKLRPPPEPEPADNPVFMASAKQAITRLERTLDRAQKRRESWPRCKACGNHVRPEDDPDRDLSPAQRWAAALVEAVA